MKGKVFCMCALDYHYVRLRGQQNRRKERINGH